MLDGLGVSYKQNYKIGKYEVDFLVKGKYIIECYGDFFHCNPRKYSSNQYNKVLKCESNIKWKKDAERLEALKELGYDSIVLWEQDIKS